MSSAATYGTLHRDETGGWVLDDLPPHVCGRAKALFKGINATARPPYRLAGGPDLDCDLDWFMQRYPLAMSDADRSRIMLGKETFHANQREVLRILSEDWKPSESTGFREGLAPRPYQTQAAELTHKLGRLLLVDELGLGKTCTAVALLTMADTLPAAIVVQPHLATQWRREIERFTPLRVHIVKGRTPYELPEADAYIFKYSNVSGWCDYLSAGPFNTVIYDEVQELRRGTETAKGQACDILTAHCAYRLGLTATPIYNYGDEIFNVCEFIAPNALGTRMEFLIEWCRWGREVGDPKALGAYLRDIHVMLRRTYEEVAGQCPSVQPANKVIRHVPYDDAVAASAEQQTRELAIRVLEGSFTESGQAAREFDKMMRLFTGLAKARAVAAVVRMLVENGEPVLLAGWHRDVYRIWLEELKDLKPAMYTGSETPGQKDKARDAFVNGDTDLLIISLRSGAGLDGLQTRGRTVVIGELDWSPKVHDQLIGRLNRPGQKSLVDAIFLLTDNGSDPVIAETLGIKASQSHGITDPFSSAPSVTSDESRVKKLARHYLAEKEPA